MMADIDDACVVHSECCNYLEVNSGYTCDFVNDINYYIKEISDLVIKARLQARETDIRARYALEFANRAVAEASSAHQVSEALSKTSRMVAELALEFSNNTDIHINEFIETFNESKNDSLNTSFLNEDSSALSAKDDNSSTEAQDSETLVVLESDQSKDTNDFDSNDIMTEAVKVQQKYQTVYPDTIPLERLPEENNLSTVWENSESSDTVDDYAEVSEQKARKRVKDNDEGTKYAKEEKLKDADDIENLETKRKMLLYRDSKIAFSKINPKASGADIVVEAH